MRFDCYIKKALADSLIIVEGKIYKNGFRNQKIKTLSEVMIDSLGDCFGLSARVYHCSFVIRDIN